MAGASFFQRASILGGASLIATDCTVNLLGDKLKDDGTCCVPACGCWCVGVVSYRKTIGYAQNFPDPGQPFYNCAGTDVANLCRICPSLVAYHLSSKGTFPRTDKRDWFCAGDTVSSLVVGDNCAAGGPHLTLTLRPTAGWVLGYDDANWRAYVSIQFQNTPQGTPATACCDTSTPCFQAINVPHLHDCTHNFLDGITCPDGTQCSVDDWNTGRACTVSCGPLDPCGNNAGALCQEWSGTDVFGCTIPSGCQICGNIVEAVFTPDNDTRDFAC